MKFYGRVLSSTRKNWLNFGGDLGIVRWVNEQKNTVIVVAYPDRGAGNDPEPFFFFFFFFLRGVGSLSQPRLNIFTVGNMRVMICLGQGGLRSLSASSFLIKLQWDLFLCVYRPAAVTFYYCSRCGSPFHEWIRTACMPTRYILAYVFLHEFFMITITILFWGGILCFLLALFRFLLVDLLYKSCIIVDSNWFFLLPENVSVLLIFNISTFSIALVSSVSPLFSNLFSFLQHKSCVLV